MYSQDTKPITPEELDLRKFIELEADEDSDGPLVKLYFTLNTPYLKKDFILDLIIRHLSEKNMEITQKVVNYVLKNFNKLFETGWTALYYNICGEPENEGHSLADMYTEQIDFDSEYYSIQLEINSDHLADGEARYSFVVSTVCDYYRWMISDDDMRVFMIDNKCCKFDTNNDDTQMLEDNLDYVYGFGGDEEIKKGIAKMFQKLFKKMEAEGFQYAKSFHEAN